MSGRIVVFVGLLGFVSVRVHLFDPPVVDNVE